MANALDPKLFELMAKQVQDYAIFLLDPSGRVMSWNAGAAAIKHYAAEEIIGKHFSIFYAPSDLERGWPDHELERAKAEGRFEDEGWRIRKDGSRFWANVVITALRDEAGALLAFSKITRDLSQRKQAEQALRESEERFRLLVDGVLDYAIYLLNPEGVVISWNSGARRIKGYEAHEVMGSHFSRFYERADVDDGKPWAELAVARQMGRAEDEGWRVRKDGSRFWARVVVSSLYDSDGALRGFAKVTQDLTQQRHSQSLETSAKELNDFIAILAHELRNPLAPIRHAAELIERAPQDEATRTMAVSIIHRQGAQLARIVDDLLDVSRITRGALLIDPRRTSIAKVIERAVETVRPACDAAKHSLVIDVPEDEDALFVQADELRLAQAFVNVLVNAIRYTESGGAISIRSYATRHEGANQVCTSINDNGRGIDPTLLPSIFKMFVQGKDPLNRTASGLGVGLALTRGIVELHHGTIEALSDGVGTGSEFIIRLPEDRSGKAAAPARTATQFKIPSKRVLVVDDNIDAALILASLLKTHGHEVVTVHNGMDALEVYNSFRPEFVLMDIGMPGMSGLEVARRMRERNRQPSPRIVAVTGWGNPEDQLRSREAGFDAHLIKPIAEARLMDILGSAS